MQYYLNPRHVFCLGGLATKLNRRIPVEVVDRFPPRRNIIDEVGLGTNVRYLILPVVMDLGLTMFA